MKDSVMAIKITFVLKSVNIVKGMKIEEMCLRCTRSGSCTTKALLASRKCIEAKVTMKFKFDGLHLAMIFMV